MPSLKQIRYFLAVADLGGFTQAAAALFVAQPALSRQIAQLEEELGFQLFEREPRGVRLTPAGAVYRSRVGSVHNLLAAAAEEGGQLARGEAGVLRLLHSSSVPARSLMPALDRFLQRCPGARIDLDRIASETQIGEVAGGRADLGIIRLPVLRRDPAVRFLELPAERLWVALPEAHALAEREALAVADLREQPFVTAVHLERGGLARLVTDLCLSRGFVPATARIISRKTSMLDLVAAGYGIAVVPERMTTLHPKGIRYLPLRDREARGLSALVLPQQATPLAQAFADIVLGMAAG
ncbi:LysR family transcriptional regulator [Azoarcus indigens]|uniref:LysR family transcriptional regulator n=1 Tax=Azoarcus indigens TaxID=29545 RepID=A0A4R6DMM8_9RHOO|nr:LysR substrate-binding domain-containing protein [Azoarcus indigens]NMG66115.1 LysR family transcriptional regulator [Azoarcus indigens]TDN46043.1 LysR family transcriptional regulator [Azoarcus indigens]